MSYPATVQETLTRLGFGHLYEIPGGKLPEKPTYCIFCIDADEGDMWEYGGCNCCGNNGYYDND